MLYSRLCFSLVDDLLEPLCTLRGQIRHDRCKELFRNFDCFIICCLLPRAFMASVRLLQSSNMFFDILMECACLMHANLLCLRFFRSWLCISCIWSLLLCGWNYCFRLPYSPLLLWQILNLLEWNVFRRENFSDLRFLFPITVMVLLEVIDRIRIRIFLLIAKIQLDVFFWANYNGIDKVEVWVGFPMHCIDFIFNLVWLLCLVLGKRRLFGLLLETLDGTWELRTGLFVLRISYRDRLEWHRIVFGWRLLLLLARFLAASVRFLHFRWYHLDNRNFYINLVCLLILVPFSFSLHLHVFFLGQYTSILLEIQAEWVILPIFRPFKLLQHSKTTSRCLLMQTGCHTGLRTRLYSGWSEVIEDCLRILVHWFDFSFGCQCRVLMVFKNWPT